MMAAAVTNQRETPRVATRGETDGLHTPHELPLLRQTLRFCVWGDLMQRNLLQSGSHNAGGLEDRQTLARFEFGAFATETLIVVAAIGTY